MIGIFPDNDLKSRIAEVNEGVLEFLSKVPEKPVHHFTNQIDIIPSSLDDGSKKRTGSYPSRSSKRD